MRWQIARNSPIVPVVLIGCGLAVCAWQVQEHVRFERTAREALIKRGRDITSTLGVILRSQRRYGLMVAKERIEPSLQGLVQSEELVAIAILAVTGEPLASAGRPLDLTPMEIEAGGSRWGEHTLTMMNLMDLGPTGTEEGTRASPAIVMTDDERRSLRSPPARRPPDSGAANSERPGGAPKEAVPPPAPGPSARPPFGKPSWMTAGQYEEVIQTKGVHSLVISLSTDEMRNEMRSDLLLRSLVSLFATGGAIISTLAWRNVEKNAELQIRLVKAGETNAHLKELNFAAAGLAHETRNPLNLIRGLAQMVAMRAQSSPELKEHASAIVEEADRVTAQLNEFIDYSKPREAHFAPVEVKRLVADVARTLLPDIEEKQVRLLQPETACSIQADEPLLRQALFNVLLNALQAVGQKGQIQVRLTQVRAREAVLEIGDDGPGVPPAERENIFKPYVTMRPKGVGLGLAIVRQIAAAHRWEVVCLANEPRGALFRFSQLRIAAPHV
jgi:signal transduction histidine kinase